MPHKQDPEAVDFNPPPPSADDTGEFEVQPFDDAEQPTGRMAKPEEVKLRDPKLALEQLQFARREGTRVALEHALLLTDSVDKPPAGSDVPRVADISLIDDPFDEPEEHPSRIAAKKHMAEYQRVLRERRLALEELRHLAQ